MVAIFQCRGKLHHASWKLVISAPVVQKEVGLIEKKTIKLRRNGLMQFPG